MKKFLIVGLGNIGFEYAETRHNIGFKIVEAMAQKHECAFETVKLGDLCTIKIKGKSLLLLKTEYLYEPQRKSGIVLDRKGNIALENVLIITDDIHLPFGSIRLKAKGSDGGHNGLKDIQEKTKHSAIQQI